MNKFASFLLYIIYVHSQSVAFNLIHFTICCRWDDLEFRTFTIAILTVVLFYILLHVDVVIIIIARIKKGFNTLLLSKLFFIPHLDVCAYCWNLFASILNVRRSLTYMNYSSSWIIENYMIEYIKMKV